MTLAVAPVNDAPVAVGDTATTNEDTPVDGNVLANDTDVENDALTAMLVDGPANGALLFNADGSFTYSPNLNYFGPDSFTYKANDGTLDSNIVTVSLTVAPVIDVAVIGGDLSSLEHAAAQLEDSTAFSIDADAISVTLFSTEAQWADLLKLYEVVVLGDGGSMMDYDDAPLFPALRDFVVDAGGGVVTTGWFAFVLPALPAEADTITPISPISTISTLWFGYSRGDKSITILDTTHEITKGFTSYPVDAGAHELAVGFDAGATVLASGVDDSGGTRVGTALPALVVNEVVGLGRTAYFGSLQMANADPYSPEVDVIFERIVAWAAGPRDVFAATDEDTPLVIDPAAALQSLQPGQVVTDSFDYTVFDGNDGTDIGTVSLTVAGRAEPDSLL